MEDVERMRTSVPLMLYAQLGMTSVQICPVLFLVRIVLSSILVRMISRLTVRIRLVRLILRSVRLELRVQELGRLFVLIRRVLIMRWIVCSLILVKPDISSSLTEPNKK